MAERLKCKTRHHQTPGREHSKTLSDINLVNIFSGQSPKATEIRAKINQWGPNQTDKICTARKPKRKQKDDLQNGRK